MWRFLSRGWKEGFERTFNLGRTDLRLKNETQKTTYAKTIPCSLILSKKLKTNCHYERNEQAKSKNNQSFQYPYDSWLGAFTFSSAFILSWILSHPCFIKKWFSKKGRIENGRSSIIRFFTKTALAQPPIPVKAVSQQEDCKEVSYGPPTAQEALEEAANELFTVHNKFMGDAENRRGVDLAQGPNRGSAPKFFLSAFKKGSIPAAYNLGQCYENGIGVKQDFSEAVKWYSWAAEKGHSTAMYNLAVFYAHGWGGLKADVQMARHWLEAAAQKGQPDAISFLALSKQSPPAIPVEEFRAWGLSEKRTKLRDVSSDPKEIYDLATSYEKDPCGDSDLPHLILELYKMASDLGHPEARSRYSLLKAFDTVGLLSEYLTLGKCCDEDPKPPVSCSSFPFPRVI